MANENPQKQFDKRTIGRYLRDSIVDEKEYDKYLKALPDLAENAAPVEATLESAEDEELEDETAEA